MKCPHCNQPIPQSAITAELQRQRGKKGWTPERREAQAARMKQINKTGGRK